MPSISKHERARGGYAHAPVHEDTTTDWRVPTTAAVLRGRVLPGPDQSRYGAANTDPLGREGPGWHKGKQSALPTRDKAK